MSGRGTHLLLAAAIVVAVGAVGTGLYVLGSPGHQRELRLDQRRVDDLAALSRAIDGYTKQHGAPPADLAMLDLGPGTERFTTDPDSGAAYEYAPSGKHGYRLCATFAAATPPVEANGFGALPVLDGVRRPHPAGRHCFELVPPSLAPSEAATPR